MDGFSPCSTEFSQFSEKLLAEAIFLHSVGLEGEGLEGEGLGLGFGMGEMPPPFIGCPDNLLEYSTSISFLEQAPIIAETNKKNAIFFIIWLYKVYFSVKSVEILKLEASKPLVRS